MKNKTTYSLKKTPLIYIVFGLIIAVCVPSVIISIYRIIDSNSFTDYIAAGDIITIVLSSTIAIIATIAFFLTSYRITDKSIVSIIGIIPSKISLNKIIKITHFTTMKTLMIFYNYANQEIKQLNLFIAENDFEKFVQDLKAVKPNVEFEIDSTDYSK